jgi:hypothetical protein
MGEFLWALGDIERDSTASVFGKAPMFNANWFASMLVRKCGNITWSKRDNFSECWKAQTDLFVLQDDLLPVA